MHVPLLALNVYRALTEITVEATFNPNINKLNTDIIMRIVRTEDTML